MTQIVELGNEITTRQEKNRKREDKETKIMSKKVKTFEEALRQTKQFKGDCPICHRPTISFGSHDYDWDLRDVTKEYSDCVLSGSDVMHHDSCFFNTYGHLD